MTSDSALDNALKNGQVWLGQQDNPRHNPGSNLNHKLSTGYPALDELCLGGWPVGAISEIQLMKTGMGEIQLLLPTLIHLSQQKSWLIWVNPPLAPYAPYLQAAGINLKHLLCVYPKNAKEMLWVLEQALAGGCSGLLAWNSRLNNKSLRRLQLAAEQSQCCCFLFGQHSQQQSPAALRLQIHRYKHHQLDFDILKRRGGWPLKNLTLCLKPPKLTAINTAVSG